MKHHEFNIKYQEYLEEGHYGLDINMPELTTELDKLFESLILIKGFKYKQIKAKFGDARFYTNLFELMGIFGSQIERLVENTMQPYILAFDIIQKRNEN